MILTDAVRPDSFKLMDKNWQIEHLISFAYNRTKNRFLSYFLALVLSFIFWIIFYIIAAIVASIFITLYLTTKSIILGIILGTIFLLMVITVAFYISSWMQLVTVEVLIQEEKMGVVETFKKMRPLVMGYFGFLAMSSLFMFGLFFLGILSLFIISILWAFWNSFSIFVYLEKRKKGLENLWYSRALINQKFWGIAWRMLLLYVAVIFISVLLASSGNGILRFGTVIVSLLSAPFILSFSYEMYKNLEEPKEVKTAKVWVALSIIGWILIAVLFVFGYMALINAVLNPNTFPFQIPTPPSLPKSI